MEDWEKSSFYRFYQSTKYFQERKVQISYDTLIDESGRNEFDKLGMFSGRTQFINTIHRNFRILRPEYDTLWVDGEALPGFPFGWESFFLPLEKKVVLDIGDSLFNRYALEKSALKKYFLSDKFPGLIQRADSVIVRNTMIQKYVSRYRNDSILIPPSLDLNEYLPISHLESGLESEFIMGFSGTHFSSHFLYKIMDVLKELSRVYPIRLVIFNGNNKLEVPIRHTHISARGSELIKEISGIDVGIYPLPNSLREMGNLCPEILEFMAMGKPVVASEIGSALDYIKHGEDGFLCGTNDDWYLSLRSLLDERDTVEAMGKKAREKIEREYDNKLWFPTLFSALN